MPDLVSFAFLVAAYFFILNTLTLELGSGMRLGNNFILSALTRTLCEAGLSSV